MSNESKVNYEPFDNMLDPKGPVMLVGRQMLKPTSIDPDNTKDIIFPPSYAGSERSSEDDDDSGDSVYNIDPPFDPKDPATHTNVCVLDSIPSQANRMEPLFKEEEYRSLVPQYEIRFAEGTDPINILEIGHRIADSAFRGTELRDSIVEAFKKYKKRDASAMAKIGPTSLIFGVWDSRGTGVKVPRLVNSIVRAFNVVPLRRSAQYSPPINYNREGLLPEGLAVKPTKYGLAPVPAPLKIGGVQINGDIRRDFSLNLELLRDLRAPLSDGEKTKVQQKLKNEKPLASPDELAKAVAEAEREAQREADLKLQRYILGLALLSFTAIQKSTLRQGCQLLPKKEPTWKQFRADGEESSWTPPTNIPELARSAAADFNVTQPPNQPLQFNKELLKSSIEADAKKKAGTKAANEEGTAEALRRLVDGLDFKGREGQKKFKANSSFKNLGSKIDEVEADASASDQDKDLAFGIKQLLTDEVGADERKQRMLALFPTATTDVTEESPAEATTQSDEEAQS